MKEIISHPGKPLIVHLREVARNCASIIAEKSLGIDIHKDILQKLAFIQGAVHDIGKATRNFQEYINSGGKIVTQPKHHALISAYLGKIIAQQYLETCTLAPFDRAILPYFLFTSIKRHHGNVKNFDEELETLSEKEEDLEILRANFHDKEVQIILDQLLSEIGLSYNWEDFKTYLSDLPNVFIEFSDFAIDTLPDEFEMLSPQRRVSYFYLHHLFYSSLLFSDKTDVKLGERKERISNFPYGAIHRYRELKGFNDPTTAINRLKNQAYFEGLANLKEQFNPAQHLYAITLPTGLGKTITSLAIGMEMRKLLNTQQSRIIISIPFTSIIDQSYAVFQDVFESPTSEVLLKHHHLAEPRYKVMEDTLVEQEVEASKFLIETWQSEIVVTTFVQLMEGIFTNNKAKLLKLPNLMNAIIILDEIQQIKYELWELVRTAFQVLAEQYHCYFILMSATQPLIFEPQREIIELIPHHKQYFRFFNRTRIINSTQEVISLEEFSIQIVAYHQQYPKKNILVILNTKKCTLNCFNEVKSRILKTTANLYFLSTFITPFERKNIIERIKQSSSTLPNIIISTQLIEAGVDISVDTVFRAFAPLDSIIQAAGRANRYAEKETPGEVYLYQIKELEKSSNSLYGKGLMMKTQNVLRDKDEIEESDYLALIEAYYHEVRKQSDNYQSEELDYLQNLKFEDIGKFNLIDYRKSESLFVQLNKTAQDAWNEYVAIYTDKNLSIFEKRESFALIKGVFYDYVINIPIPYDQEHITFDSEPVMHFYLSRLEKPSTCYQYDPKDFRNNTGYQPRDTLSI